KLGEAYIDQRLDVQGTIGDVIELADRLSKALLGDQPSLSPHRTAHDKALDAEAISYHYDLSNEFYALWLDPEMVYSCAYFKHPQDDLAQAQLQKLDHICRKLRLKAGERLLDVGCGWGGLARHAARHYGVEVYGITLSRAQLELARQRVTAEKLESRVQLDLRDYRDLGREEEFDKVVSVGMFEHVGHANLAEYFKILHGQVKPGGLLLNHGITARHVDGRPVSRGAGKFIGRYVFPHGELPHLSTAIASMSSQGLEVVDVESLRLHYALTLEHWSNNLERSLDQAGKHISDKALRIWRIYLAGCAYGFRRGWMNIHQILAVKPDADGSHRLPLTRADVYS
ncbi:MAG TPA: methyltransferase domain-containing protein, partial [Pseudomonas xinjiangensis]|nr:methyltransferase domain-containing protein [Halopseudomonas xinjiangensis]